MSGKTKICPCIYHGCIFTYIRNSILPTTVVYYANYAFQGASTPDTIDEWKSKLTMLLRNKDKQELVSREKKDRRDFEQIATLARRMGLYR